MRIAKRLCGGCAIQFFAQHADRSSSAPGDEETQVKLARDNFVLVRTNVVGRSRGFSLLGLITIYPATLNKAMNRLYASAGLRSGHPQTIAHLVIEQTGSYWILFGIPEVDARADIIEFKPAPPPTPPPRPPPPPGMPP